MSSELSCEASDEASENELLDRSLSVWRGWSAIEKEDFTPVPLDLHTACSIGQCDWVRSIIARNECAALDKKNKGGWTSLMYACYIGHDNIVNLLVKAGCQMNKLKNPRGHTPLMLAASCGNESVARTLVRNGAELEVMDKSGWTALFHATYAGHQNFVAYLLEAGANINAVEPTTGLSPFMLAATEGHEIIVQLFLQQGVNVHAKAYNGDLARSLALIKGYMKIVSLIDNHIMPINRLRSEPGGLDFYLSSSDDDQPRPVRGLGQRKSKGPSIRDGPDAIARMIDRSRPDSVQLCADAPTPKGYMSFSDAGEKGGTTQLSYRDVTSPINPEDYKDAPEGTDVEDVGEDSNAFSKTGAITIKSSSSSSGGLVAALGLSREGSLDSDDSRCYDSLNRKTVESLGGVDSTPEKRDECLGKDGETSCLDSTERDDEKIVDKKHLPLLKMPQDGDVLTKEKPRAVVSPLRDYFPLDVSFPPVSKNEANSQRENRLEAGNVDFGLHQSEDDATRRLPTDSMSHSDIVSAYLMSMGPVNEQMNSRSERGVGKEKATGSESVMSVNETRVDDIGNAVFVRNRDIHQARNMDIHQARKEDRFIPSVDTDRAVSNFTQQTRPPFHNKLPHADQFSSNPANANLAGNFGTGYSFPHGSIPPPDAMLWGGCAQFSQQDYVQVPFGMTEGKPYHPGYYHPTSTHSTPASYPLPQPAQHHHYQQNHSSNALFIRPPQSSLFYPQGQGHTPLLSHPPPHQLPQQHHHPHTHQQHLPPPIQQHHEYSAQQHHEYSAQQHHNISHTKDNFQNFPQYFYTAAPGHPGFDSLSYYKAIPSDIYYSDMNTLSGLHLGQESDGHLGQESDGHLRQEADDNIHQDGSEVFGPRFETSEHDGKLEQENSQTNSIQFLPSSAESDLSAEESRQGHKAAGKVNLQGVQIRSDHVQQMTLVENFGGIQNKTTNLSSDSHSINTTSNVDDSRSGVSSQIPNLPRTSATTAGSSVSSSVIRPASFRSNLLSKHSTEIEADSKISPQAISSNPGTTTIQSNDDNVHIKNVNLEAQCFAPISSAFTLPPTSSITNRHVSSSSSLSSQPLRRFNPQIHPQFPRHHCNPSTDIPNPSNNQSTISHTNMKYNDPSSHTKALSKSNHDPVHSKSSALDPVPSVPHSVMIPGHTTSQPVSQSIGWLGPDGHSGFGPKDLGDMLAQLGLCKYLDKFEEQDVDLQVFLSLTDNDLKEVGIKLFGPRKKMANAIARWHSQAPLPSNSLEQAYADRLEGEMQELAIQLNQACANEDKLKAQVLQEQQLRSVTESVLMEVRGGCERTRRTLEDAQGTMRTMGEAMTRLRLNHKEMRKHLEGRVIIKTKMESASPSSSISNMTTVTNKDCKSQELNEDVLSLPDLTCQDSTAVELMKKSEKCLKEMHKALSVLVHSADRVLKSTQDLSTLDKGLEDM